MENFEVSGWTFHKRQDRKIEIRGHGEVLVLIREDSEGVKNWLEEALKPRYEISHPHSTSWIIVDTKQRTNVAAFHQEKDFDAKKEAEKLCKRLNEEC